MALLLVGVVSAFVRCVVFGFLFLRFCARKLGRAGVRPIFHRHSDRLDNCENVRLTKIGDLQPASLQYFGNHLNQFLRGSLHLQHIAKRVKLSKKRQVPPL